MDMLDRVNEDDASKELSDIGDDETLFEQLKAECLEDSEHNREWRQRVPSDFAFAGAESKQWDDKDMAVIEDQQGRVPIVFNRTNVIVQAVSGMEINTRTQAAFYPRDPMNLDEVKANEVLSAGMDWMGDQCKAHRHQTGAFRNAFICGLGVTEAIVDFEETRKGRYVEKRCNPTEFRWDKNAREPNLTDGERFFRVRTGTTRKARRMFPGEQLCDIDASWAEDSVDGEAPSAKGSKTYDAKAKITFVHAQWVEREAYHLIEAELPQLQGLMPEQMQAFAELQGQFNGETELTPEEHGKYTAMLKQMGVEYKDHEMTRKVHKQAFLGANKILGEVKDAPCKKAFNWNFITYDLSYKGLPYGAIALMRDPQRFANKWLSQTLHILNSTAKGGILAERDAFDNIEEAKKSYAKSEAITFLKPGAISKNKIMAKPGAGLSAPYLQLTEFAISAIRDAVGVSLEMLGMRETDQPGVLEHQRKQAGLTILAPLFDAHREFKERNAVVRLFYLQTVFSDGRLIRVAGNGDQDMRFMQLIKDETAGDYDIEIGEAPTSPNQKEQNWMMISQLLPIFVDIMSPPEIVEMLEFSPLPVRFVEMLKKKMSAEPTPEELAEKELIKQRAVAETGAIQAKAGLDEAKTMSERLNAVLGVVEKAMAAKRDQVAAAQAAVANASAQNSGSANIEQLLRRIGMVEQSVAANPGTMPVPPQAPQLGVMPSQDDALALGLDEFATQGEV